MNAAIDWKKFTAIRTTKGTLQMESRISASTLPFFSSAIAFSRPSAIVFSRVLVIAPSRPRTVVDIPDIARSPRIGQPGDTERPSNAQNRTYIANRKIQREPNRGDFWLYKSRNPYARIPEMLYKSIFVRRGSFVTRATWSSSAPVGKRKSQNSSTQQKPR